MFPFSHFRIFRLSFILTTLVRLRPSGPPILSFDRILAVTRDHFLFLRRPRLVRRRRGAQKSGLTNPARSKKTFILGKSSQARNPSSAKSPLQKTLRPHTSSLFLLPIIGAFFCHAENSFPTSSACSHPRSDGQAPLPSPLSPVSKPDGPQKTRRYLSTGTTAQPYRAQRPTLLHSHHLQGMRSHADRRTRRNTIW